MKKTINFVRGFTLIELLVVISIIGMLSSIILVSLDSARDKGRVGGALEFASHNYQVLGADVWAYYDFTNSFADGNNLQTVSDFAQNGNDLTCDPDAYVSIDTPAGIGNNKSGEFYGGDGRCYPLTPGSIPDMEKYTISMWVKPLDVPSSNSSLVHFETDSSFSLSVYMNSAMKVAFRSNGINIVTSDGSVPLNKWSHVAVSYNGSKTSIYIDGKLSASANWGDSILSGNLDVFDVGNSFNFGVAGTKRLDDVAIYTDSIN